MVAGGTSSTKGVRVLLVDDQPIIREGLRHILESHPGVQVCGQSDDPGGAATAVARFKPDVVLMDLGLRTGDSLNLTRVLRDRFPALPILILAPHHESLFAERAIRAGASGYIMKGEAPESLIHAVHEVAAGGIYMSEPLRQSVLQRMRGPFPEDAWGTVDRLSDRELEVFQFLGEGYSAQQIAALLHLSVKTVETHRSHIKHKLQLANNTQLISSATQWVTASHPPAPRA